MEKNDGSQSSVTQILTNIGLRIKTKTAVEDTVIEANSHLAQGESHPHASP
jgi:hypothetical protein